MSKRQELQIHPVSGYSWPLLGAQHKHGHNFTRLKNKLTFTLPFLCLFNSAFKTCAFVSIAITGLCKSSVTISRT